MVSDNHALLWMQPETERDQYQCGKSRATEAQFWKSENRAIRLRELHHETL